MDLHSYDHIIVAFSGGKDSTACVLHLKEAGADLSKVELWHHDVDGREGSELMDWPITRGYCESFAKALDLPLYYSWKVGGFEREMLRDQALAVSGLLVDRMGGPPVKPYEIAQSYKPA